MLRLLDQATCHKCLQLLQATAAAGCCTGLDRPGDGPLASSQGLQHIDVQQAWHSGVTVRDLDGVRAEEALGKQFRIPQQPVEGRGPNGEQLVRQATHHVHITSSGSNSASVITPRSHLGGSPLHTLHRRNAHFVHALLVR
jgi:hypothetical protein